MYVSIVVARTSPAAWTFATARFFVRSSRVRPFPVVAFVARRNALSSRACALRTLGGSNTESVRRRGVKPI